MDKLSQWVALTVAGCLAVFAGGWFLLVSPVRTQAEEVRAQIDAEETGNDALRAQLAMLKARAKDLPQQQAALAEVAAKVPTDPALPLLIRALDRASDEAGVELLTLAPGTPQSAAPVAAAPVTSGEEADGTTTAAPVPSAPALTRIPLSVDVAGGYFEVQQFVNRLEGLDRALRVTGLTVSPGANPVDPDAPPTTEDGRSLKATVTGEVFFTPAAGGPAGTSGTVPAASAATPTSGSGSTSTASSSTTSGSASAGDAVPN